MSSVATVTWSFVPGSLATKVEYKKASDSNWITPTIPTNPTPTNTYPLSVEDNIVYDLRLSTISGTCTPKSTTTQFIHTGLPQCCPATYMLSPDGTFCQKSNIVAATPPSSSANIGPAHDISYTNFGTYIYNPGYNADGTGTSTIIPTSNGFWWNPTLSSSIGPLNRAGCWGPTPFPNQDIGFTVCITAPTTGIYYIGMGVDNYGILQIDGNTIITQNPTTLAAQYNSIYPGIGATVTFKIWHVYPVTLTQGTHVLNIVGHNVSGPASFGVEIYKLTSSQIAAATSYADMGAGLIFSSKDSIGQPVQIGSGGVGYTCPSGYSLVLCDGPAYCKQVLTNPLIDC